MYAYKYLATSSTIQKDLVYVVCVGVFLIGPTYSFYVNSESQQFYNFKILIF
jgi:hypothetical protein